MSGAAVRPRPKKWGEALVQARARVAHAADLIVEGTLNRMVGMTLEAVGCEAAVGGRCLVDTAEGKQIEAESKTRCPGNEACELIEADKITRDYVAQGKLPRVEWTEIIDHRDHAVKLVGADHVGAMGFSAGGHLALMLGVTGPDDGLEGERSAGAPSSKVQAVVNYFGPTDLTAPVVSEFAKGLIRDFLGGLPSEKPEIALKASPVTFVTRDDAAILTFHGTKDPLVPYDQANRLANAMARVGLEGRTELIADAGHGWYGQEMKRTMEQTHDFFEMHLRPKKPTGRTEDSGLGTQD